MVAILSLKVTKDGFYVGPCLFDNVTDQMEIYKQEIFGPVLCIARADTYEEGLRLAMEHEYGNGVAIFTRDGDTARDFTFRINVGMVGGERAYPSAFGLLHVWWLETLWLW